MQLAVFETAADFLARAQSFLARQEAHNNLPLGISAGLVANPNLYSSESYFVVVEDDAAVVAAALMTPPHNLVLAMCESREPLQLIAQQLHASQLKLPGVTGASEAALHFAEIWQSVTGQCYEKTIAERIYQLTTVAQVPVAPGSMRRMTETDRDWVRPWLIEYQQEAMGRTDADSVERSITHAVTSPPSLRGMYVWEDGEPVSLAGYGGPTPNGIRVGPVYTPPQYRGKGYATNCVAALSQQLLDEGRKYCFLFTDLSNPTSNHIYQVIGYEPVCDVDEYRFILPEEKAR